jgi:uncharacterized protein YjcR
MQKELEEWLKLHKFHFYMGGYQTKDLAEYLGVTPRTIQRWLNDKGKPNKEQLSMVKQYLSSQESKNQSL